MNEIIYLEPDEDITGVILRVKDIDSKAVCLVVPRGGTISQSVVNLKLLKREIEKIGKIVSIVTKDKISKNLASQVGITVYPSANEAKNARIQDMTKPAKENEKPEGFSTSKIQINRYSRDNDEYTEEDVCEEGEEDEKDQFVDGEDVSAGDDEDIPEGNRDDSLERERAMIAHAKPVIRPKKENNKIEEKSMQKNEDTPKKNLSSRKKPLIIITIVVLLIALTSSMVCYPSAEAKVTLATTDYEFSLEVIASKEIVSSDVEAVKIPAKLYEVSKESEKEFNATGKKDIGTKASGEITFYNDMIPQAAVTIPNGTQLTADGKIFVVDGAVTVPQNTVTSLLPLKTTPGSVKAKIIAKENGDSYNIAAAKFTVNSFTGDKKEKVYGQSTSALTGGMSKEIVVVTQDDIYNSKKILDEELDTVIKSEISSSSTADNIKLISSSIEKTEISFTSTKQADEESAKFSLKLQIKMTELGFSENEMQSLMLAKAEESLASDEMFVSPNSSQINYEVESVDSKTGEIKMKVKFTGKKGKEIEESKIKDLLTKVKFGSAESKIEALEGVKDAKIIINPNFWPMLPFLKQRIKVSFDYQNE